MCFSASASFVAAGFLSYIGYLSLSKVRTNDYMLVAGIPLLFAVQQAAEGLVWLTLGLLDYQLMHMIAAYIFLAFAFTVWPSWIPVSLWLCEHDMVRKKRLAMLSMLGGVVTIYTAYILVSYPVSVQTFNCSIWYIIQVKSLITRAGDLGIYAFVVVTPFFVSSLPGGIYFGSMLFVSLLFTYVYMYTTLISVWCFFAALFSVLLYGSLYKVAKG